MLLRKIKLRNFRNFKNAEIEFSEDPEKKFTIVLGKNTFGKTTLIKAFLWCLYRENLFSDKVLLNKDVARYMSPGESATVSVELELIHKSCSYKITTKEIYLQGTSRNISVRYKAFTSILKMDGINQVPVDSNKVAEEIDNILRNELKEYFFFDGENNSIEKISSRRNLTDAVSNILGLSRIETLRDYFDPSKSESVTSRLEREIIVDDNNELNGLTQSREKAVKDLEELEKRTKENKEELERLENQKIEKERILDDNKDVKIDQQNKRKIESDLANQRERKEADMKRLIQAFNCSDAYLKVLFANSYLKFDFQKLKDESSFNNKESYKGINEEAVNELIKRGKCVCGCEIREGNDAYNHLMEARQHMEPHDYGKYIDDFVSAESSNVYNSKTILNNIAYLADSVLTLIQDIEDNESKLKSIKKRLEGRLDVGEIQTEIRNIEEQIGNKKYSIRFAEENSIPNLRRDVETLDEKIKKAAIDNEKNNLTKECIRYANYIYRTADKSLVTSKEYIHKKLQEEVGAIFKSMYHGNLSIVIDDNFKASTSIDLGGESGRIDGSTGLGTVMNYSFVAGLLKLAKESIIGRLNPELSEPDFENEVFPLVMDAPFSNTDEVHIKNICEALPKYCDQIVMFVMEKDFNYAQDTIRDKIGKVYRLEQRSQTESIVVEEK